MWKMGDAFLGAAPGQTPHLWVVISHPEKNAVLAVNLTTRREGSDLACLLGPGDHPFIQHETVVLYRMARMFPLTMLDQMEKANPGFRQKAIPQETLAKIYTGAETSKFFPSNFSDLLERQGLILQD